MSGSERAAGPLADNQASQARTIRLLEDPATHGGAPVTVIETHVHRVFLAGERVYKLKRAVRYPYLDYSTIDRRHAMAGAEVRINRRTAAELYLGLTPVMQRGTGLALGRLTEPDEPVPEAEADDVVDWLVTMRRFDNDCLMSVMADGGRLDLATVHRLVDELTHFHGAVQTRRQDNTAARFAASLEESLDELRSAPHLFPPTDVAALSQAAGQAMARFGPVMDQRGRDGFVRHCHGDLHLRNVYVTADGRPVPFDAAEFSIDLVTVDVWDDLAYLLMDLWHRGARHLANGAMNRYAENTADHAGMAPLPLYLAARAAIRAKVAASAHALARPGGRAALAREARAYLRSARLFLAPRPPRLAAIGGLSGTGKTTLARALAPGLGSPPGALVLRSDVTRKIMAGAGRLDRLRPESYTQQSSAAVYERLWRMAADGLARGQSVIVDAVHSQPQERAAIAGVARHAGTPFAGLWLEADTATLTSRIAGRTGDESDATPEVVAIQASRDTGPMTWPRLDVSGERSNTVRSAWDRLRRAGL